MSMMEDSNFGALLDMLPVYLLEHDINPHKHFKCIHPDHDDSSASMHVYKGRYLKCFGCGATGTIATAAHWLEGMPPKGHPEHYSKNLLVLAKKFGISLPSYLQGPSLRVYDTIVRFIQKVVAPREAEKLGIPEKELYTEHWVPRPEYKRFQNPINPAFVRLPPEYWNELWEGLGEQGFTRTDLQAAGVFQKFLVTRGRAYLMPLWKHTDICAGFYKRDPDKEDVESGHIHSPNNDVFNKSTYLYGTHLGDDAEWLFVVEGQKDTLAASLHTVEGESVKALGAGTKHLTTEQAQYLVSLKQDPSKLVLAFDSDNPGTEGIKAAVESLLMQGVVCRVHRWKYKDPDESVGRGEILNLPNNFPTSLEWYLDQIDLTELSTLQALCNLLAKISVGIVRFRIVKEVAALIQMPEALLSEDVERIVQAATSREDERIVQEVTKALDEIKRTPYAASNIVEEASKRIQLIKKRSISYDNLGLQQLFNRVLTQTASEAQHDIPFREGGLGGLGRALSENGIGWTTTGCFGLLSGKPHTGKSLTLLQAAEEALGTDPNVMVFLFSTDDSLELLLPRMIAARVFHPDYHISDLQRTNLHPEIKLLRDAAVAQFQSWIAADRFIAKDSSYTRHFNVFKDLVKYYRDKYPERKVFIINDNFHRNGDYLDLDDNGRVDRLAGDMKDFAVKERLAIWCSVENRKQSMYEPDPIYFSAGNDDIKGAGGLMYYATIIMHTLNDLILRGKDIEQAVWVHRGADRLLPRTVLKIGKNKHAGENISLAFNMYPKSSFFEETNYQDAVEEAVERAITLGYIRPKQAGY